MGTSRALRPGGWLVSIVCAGWGAVPMIAPRRTARAAVCICDLPPRRFDDAGAHTIPYIADRSSCGLRDSLALAETHSHSDVAPRRVRGEHPPRSASPCASPCRTRSGRTLLGNPRCTSKPGPAAARGSDPPSSRAHWAQPSSLFAPPLERACASHRARESAGGGVAGLAHMMTHPVPARLAAARGASTADIQMALTAVETSWWRHLHGI